MGWHWTDWFRLRCKAIAAFSTVRLGPNEQMAVVVLCRRWRFHRGECRGGTPQGESAHRDE